MKKIDVSGSEDEGPVKFILSDGRVETIPIVTLQINSDCNYACPGCYMLQGGRAGKDDSMIPDDTERIMDAIRPEMVDILGGEPLMSSHLNEIVDLCHERDVEINLVSNLSMMNEETAKYLLDRGVFLWGKLNIGNPQDKDQIELQAKMIGKNKSYVEKMLKGIQIVQDAGYDKNMFTLENLLRKDNLHLVPEYVRWCLENDVRVYIEMPACANPKIEEYFRKITPTSDEIIDIIPKIKEVYAEFGMEVNEPFLPPFMSTKACNVKENGMYFRKKKDEIRMYPCTSSDEDLGTLEGHESVVSALEKPVMKTRRRLNELYEIGEIEGKCGKCEYFVDMCKGGCRATAENLGGLKSSYQFCWV